MPGAVCLTFDDCYLDSWVEALPLFAMGHARVTFFVSGFPVAVDRLGLSKLAKLARAGHEIGCHSVHHYNPERFLSVFTEDEYMRDEVVPALRAMRGCGIDVRSWCYPFNAYTPELAKRIGKLVTVQRARADTTEQALVQRGDRFIHACSIDTHVGGLPVRDINATMGLLDQAATTDRILVLYGHEIAFPNSATAHVTTPATLLAIFNAARERGMSFVTATDIAGV
jgi:peptidoglycan/xylan/chitin deacetylase (PgdA/CDA1 family)